MQRGTHPVISESLHTIPQGRLLHRHRTLPAQPGRGARHPKTLHSAHESASAVNAQPERGARAGHPATGRHPKRPRCARESDPRASAANAPSRPQGTRRCGSGPAVLAARTTVQVRPSRVMRLSKRRQQADAGFRGLRDSEDVGIRVIAQGHPGPGRERESRGVGLCVRVTTHRRGAAGPGLGPRRRARARSLASAIGSNSWARRRPPRCQVQHQHPHRSRRAGTVPSPGPGPWAQHRRPGRYSCTAGPDRPEPAALGPIGCRRRRRPVVSAEPALGCPLLSRALCDGRRGGGGAGGDSDAP